MGTPAIDRRRLRSVLPIKSEYDLHKWTVQLLRKLAYPHVKFWHCPTGEKREIETAGKLAAMGTVAGIPDLQIFIHSAPRFLELKYGRNDLTQEQRAFITWAQNNRIPVAVCRTQDEVAAQLELWGAIRPTGWQFGGHE